MCQSVKAIETELNNGLTMGESGAAPGRRKRALHVFDAYAADRSGKAKDPLP